METCIPRTASSKKIKRTSINPYLNKTYNKSKKKISNNINHGRFSEFELTNYLINK